MNTTAKSQEIGVIGKIIIPKEIENFIDYLHKSIGATEWSGILFYKLTKGNIAKLKDLEFTAEFIYPMNIGNSTYTEFEYGSEVMNAFDIKESLIDCQTSMIHSHHNMAAFFSGTDNSELLDNCKHFNYYISLIVNFTKEYKCKIAFPSKTKTTFSSIIKNALGKLVTIKREIQEDNILVGDLNIEFENRITAPQWIVDRVASLKQKKTEAAKIVLKTPNTGVNATKGTGRIYNWNMYDEYNDDTWYNKPVVKLPTPKQFLSSLLNLDVKYKDDAIENAIAGLLMEGVDLQTYSVDLGDKVEDIHDQLYGDDKLFDWHCKKAIEELEKCKQLFSGGDENVYTAIKENLEVYV